jgi:pyroglutamyl-peptidase
VATRVAGRRRPAFDGTRRIAHVFATRYDAVDRELPALLAREKPDAVVMFGVATRSRRLRVEQRARNRIALLPDAGRYRPAAHAIAPRRDALRHPLPIARLLNAAREAGVAAAPSRNAGAYLCNYVYWRALEATASPEGPGFAIFIHLPQVRSKRPLKKRPKRLTKTLPKKGQMLARRAPRLDDLVRVGEAIVLAMNSLAAARRR